MTSAQQRRMKKMKLRYAKYQVKWLQYKRKLKIGGTERKLASIKKRMKRLGDRMDKITRKMYAYEHATKGPHQKTRNKRSTCVVRKAAPKKVVEKVQKKSTEKKVAEKIPPHLQKDIDARTLKAKDVPQEMYERISRAAHRTFDAIGGDLMNLVQETGGHSMKQGEVIESVFDADRMRLYGGDKEAEEYTHQLSWDELTKLGKKIFPYKSYS